MKGVTSIQFKITLIAFIISILFIITGGILFGYCTAIKSLGFDCTALASCLIAVGGLGFFILGTALMSELT